FARVVGLDQHPPPLAGARTHFIEKLEGAVAGVLEEDGVPAREAGAVRLLARGDFRGLGPAGAIVEREPDPDVLFTLVSAAEPGCGKTGLGLRDGGGVAGRGRRGRVVNQFGLQEAGGGGGVSEERRGSTGNENPK